MTISSPTTSLDKKFMLNEKSKEKFHPIPLHVTQAHVEFSVTKHSTDLVESNQSTAQV